MKAATHDRYRHHSADGTLLWASGLGELDQELITPDSAEFQDVLRAQEYSHNALADEGEQFILDVYLRGATAPTSHYLRLYNDTPVETDTLATLTGEVTGTGYTGAAVARNTTDWPTLALVSGDYKATMLTKRFTAGSGGWTAATYLVLAANAQTGTSGKLVAYNALSATRTLATVGDYLDVDLAVSLA